MKEYTMSQYANKGDLVADMRAELAPIRAENERLRERVRSAEYVLKQSRPESGYWDTYGKEALK